MNIKMNSQDVPRLIILFIFTLDEIQNSLQQQCRPIQPEKETGFALIGTEYTSFQTEHHALCLLECKKAERCMSLNYFTSTSRCDLSTQTKESRPERYEPRKDSIYFNNPAGRIPATFKGMKALPAKSCLEILVSGGSIGTGVYWLDPANTGNPIKAYCDMTTNGGGWTIVKKIVLQNTSPLDFKISNVYHVIESYDRNDINVLPTVRAMFDILQKMGFQQIHFYCHKKSTGRVLSIVTKNNTAGQQVVHFFSNETISDIPHACGSFERLPEDTSILAQNCEKWGNGQATWGNKKYYGIKRFARRPISMSGHNFGYNNGYLLCDDSETTLGPHSPGDSWQISLR